MMEPYKARWKALASKAEPKRPDEKLVYHYNERIKDSKPK